MKSMNCYCCERDIKIEGPDAITFFHVRDNRGVCEDCLLVCFEVYAKQLSKNVTSKDYVKKPEAKKDA